MKGANARYEKQLRDSDLIKKDENLNKLLQVVSKKENAFWSDYGDNDVMSNDLLDDAVRIMYLQRNAINNLMAKIKILEGEPGK